MAAQSSEPAFAAQRGRRTPIRYRYLDTPVFLVEYRCRAQVSDTTKDAITAKAGYKKSSTHIAASK